MTVSLSSLRINCHQCSQPKYLKNYDLKVIIFILMVKIDGSNYHPFEINSGVRQRDGMYPIFFNIVIEEALQKVLDTDLGVVLGEKLID